VPGLVARAAVGSPGWPACAGELDRSRRHGVRRVRTCCRRHQDHE